MAGLEGQTLGSYEILAKLGQGGMGAVYKARDTRLQRFVAIKVLPVQLATDEEFVQRFQREAIAAAQFCHSNLVQVFDIGESGDLHFIIMELVEGESLGHRLQRKGRMSPREAIAVTTYIGQGLAYAWNKAKLIHRDIKPANIFLSKDGEVKLGDLGLAKSLQDAASGLTLSGTIMGTPHYMSPEQGRGDKQLDCRSDIYSLGCVLYHMLAGQPPFQSDSTATLIYKHVHEAPPPLRAAAPDCPEDLVETVDWMMAKKPEDRPQTYEEVLAELAAVRHALLHPPAAAPKPAVAQPKQAEVASHAPVTMAAKKAPAANDPKSPSFALIMTGTLAASLLLFGLLLWSPWSPRPAPVTGTLSAPPPVVTEKVAAREDHTWQNSINLLPLIDPQQDAVAGNWSLADGALKTSAGQFARIQIPYVPPVEYDYRLIFSVQNSESTFWQILRCAGHGFDWVVGGGGIGTKQSWCGFEDLGDKHVGGNNPSSVVMKEPLQKDRPYASMVQVRKDGVKAFLDGDLVSELKTDYQNLYLPKQLVLPDKRCLGFGAHKGMVMIHRVEVREITGQGTFTRGMPAAVDGAFIKEVATLPAEQQVKRVMAKLKELNPAFDPAAANEQHRIENGAVTMLALLSFGLRDISPLRALPELRDLSLTGTLTSSGNIQDRGALKDLAPLAGMKIEKLAIRANQVSDLAPLKGIPLSELSCEFNSELSDLTPLSEMRLNRLFCTMTKVSDLSPLKNTGLSHLIIENTPVTSLMAIADLKLVRLSMRWTPVQDLSPLRNMPLNSLMCEEKTAMEPGNLAILKAIPTLKNIDNMSPAEFWKKAEAGKAPVADETAWKDAINLMPLIDPKRDAIKGEWTLINGTLTGVMGGSTSLQLPYQPPEEYDFRMVFTRVAGNDTIYQILTGGRRSFVWAVAAFHGKWFGFEQIDEQDVDLNPSHVRMERNLENGRRYTSLVQVRKDGLKAFLDGRLITEWKTNYRDMRLPVPLHRRDDHALGVGTYQSSVVFHRLEVREVTGKGTFTQVAPAVQSSAIAADDAFIQEVGALPAEQQVQRVIAKLKELNPGYDGREVHRVKDGRVEIFAAISVEVSNIAPVAALKNLEFFGCGATAIVGTARVKLSDLSPLKGLPLKVLQCPHTSVRDLSPLRDMPLTTFFCNGSAVSDLSPLRGMPLLLLQCQDTEVRDLSVLRDMPLRLLFCDPTVATDPANRAVLRAIKTLEKINNTSAAEFWGQAELGPSGKAAGSSAPRETGAIRLWSTESDVQKHSGVAWENGVLRLDGEGLIAASRLSHRDALLRAEIKMNRSAHSRQMGLRSLYGNQYDLAIFSKVITLYSTKTRQLSSLKSWPLPRTYQEDEWARVELRVVGDDITVAMDGQTLGTVHDTSQPQAGSPHVYAQANGYFRNIVYLPLDKETGAGAVQAQQGSGTTPAGIKALFNGRNLTGWRARDTTKRNEWSIRSGVLVNARPGTDLLTEERFTDFLFHCEFKLAAGANSGVYLRGRYEIQLMDDAGKPVTDQTSGGIYKLIAPAVNASKAPGVWQTLDAAVAGLRVQVILNGKKVMENGLLAKTTVGALDQNVDQPGPLLLQSYGGQVEFRNLLVAPLSPGANLQTLTFPTGWPLFRRN